MYANGLSVMGEEVYWFVKQKSSFTKAISNVAMSSMSVWQVCPLVIIVCKINEQA